MTIHTIRRRDNRFPSAREVGGQVQQIYEQQLELVIEYKGRFLRGLLVNWTNTSIFNRVRQMQEQIEKAMGEHSKANLFSAWPNRTARSSLLSWSFEDKAGAQQILQREEVDTLDIVTYREFQRLKLKAIQLILDNYGKLPAQKVDDANRQQKMLEVISFLVKEKVQLAATLGIMSI
jgi:hypothetical protein